VFRFEGRLGDSTTRLRFVREARLTGRLEHPSIVPLYDLIDPLDGSPPCYAMRFVAGAIMGTPAFMAPELVEGEPATRRSDIYALGAILYTILSGKHAYEGTNREVMEKVKVSEPPSPLHLERFRPKRPRGHLPESHGSGEAHSIDPTTLPTG
jgi:serine/threonine protein kinase